MKFLDIIQKPVDAINKAKKRDMNNTLFALFVSSALFALSFLLMTKQFLYIDISAMVTMFLSVFILVIIGEVVISYVTKVFMNVALSRGSYYEALTANVYSLPSLSVGVLVFSILEMIPVIGMLIGALLLMGFIALSISTGFRAFKELYKTDLITVYVCFGLIFVSLILALYLVIFTSAMSLFSMGSLI